MSLTEEQRTPPKAAQDNAKKVLRWKEEHGDEVDGMTSVGWRRANQLADGEPLSLDVIKRMAQFARHEDNKEIAEKHKSEPWKDNGYVAWLGWGGDEGIDWAKRMSDKSELSNARQKPVRYFARHMVQGVARYTQQDGSELNLYAPDDAITDMNESFEGCPVYVGHQNVDLEKIQEEADGYVVKSFYNEVDGWHWAEIMVVSDKGHEAVGKGWAVSNAYIPTLLAEGGTRLNVPYDKELKGGEFTHLAIVPEPRYEDACIMTVDAYKNYCKQKREKLNELKNSKEDENKKGVNKMLKFFKSEKKEVSADEITNTSDLSGFTMEIDGKDVPLTQMVNAIEEMKAEKEKDSAVDMDKEIKVGDETMTIKELVSTYKNMCEKKNEAMEEEKRQEEEAEEEERMKKEAKENSKASDELKNAMQKASAGREEDVSSYVSQEDRLKLGRERF